MAKKLNINVEGKNIKSDNDIVKNSLIQSNFNYETAGIDDQVEIATLMKLENEVKFHQEKTLEHIMRYSEAIYEANKIFAKRGSGSFGLWTDNLKISRETANVAVRRYTMYLESKNEKVMELPTRVIKQLTGQNKEAYENSEIMEVIEAENPTKMLVEINTKKEVEKFSENESFLEEFLTREKIKKLHAIEKLKNEVKEIEEELKKIKK